MNDFKYVRAVAEPGIGDVPLVGGKNASPGEMFRELAGDNILVPDGFATVADACYVYLDHNGLRGKISAAYGALREGNDSLDPAVAVRSSATAEDLPDASFAGQQETDLNVCREDHLQRSCKRVLASLFTNRAIAYRVHKGFDHMAIALSIGDDDVLQLSRFS